MTGLREAIMRGIKRHIMNGKPEAMQQLTEYQVITALKTVKEDIVPLLSAITIEEDKVSFVITLTPQETAHAARLEAACRQAVQLLPGVKMVNIVMTAETKLAQNSSGPARKAVWNRNPIEGVNRIIAVSSGKGGVGKSTTAVNLAYALQRRGKQVGLLDADIYGPSLPRMLGINRKPDVIDNRIMPLTVHGIRCMSIGFMTGEDSAIIWRGPQATKALNQMLRDVAWGDLDILLIDMPPGTGDVHLSLAQQVPLSGAVIVTTPQEVALADARKSIDMFQKVQVPILGIIENMSGFTDPDSGRIHAIFGEGGGKRLAAETGSPFLGSIPIEMDLRIASDKGEIYPDKAGIYEKISLIL